MPRDAAGRPLENAKTRLRMWPRGHRRASESPHCDVGNGLDAEPTLNVV